MKILFKYYSDKLDAEYFNEPTLKLTSSATLNDPFERIIPRELSEITQDMYKGAKIENHSFSRTFNKITNDIYIHSCGIVSLSETPRNILMWAHYTNQHKGICIGYEREMLTKNEKQHSDYPSFYKPIKVNYDNRRFDKFTDSIDGATLNDKRKNILIKSLTTKSNDWIYEKEHRIIIPMLDYDDIKYIGRGTFFSDYGNYIEKTGESSFRVKDSNLEIIYMICTDPDFIFRKKIDKTSLTSIYFGCNIDQDYKFNIINMIKSNNHFLNINLYQMEPDQNEFELIVRPIDINTEKRVRKLF
ncbi:DUF2971 domain-containing protein [Aeromonas hydrophila]|uniref:DUF2971 domain-containing protein n=1 Tax=Aeromonas hydrophila TaxID=644 RepID=UPI002169A3EC|nr:DUF2971 domain-containing protein [Aeromonas hydrophila]MCS3792712.1 hypothetical protein [Aeromonas hydrophila]